MITIPAEKGDDTDTYEFRDSRDSVCVAKVNGVDEVAIWQATHDTHAVHIAPAQALNMAARIIECAQLCIENKE